ncbi:MAG: glycogen-binding domain-containing protein [Bacteroidota bacterium]
MRMKLKMLLLCAYLLASVGAWSQANPKNSCRIEGDRLVFTYNLNWTESQKKEFIDLFDIDSAVITNIEKGTKEFTVNGVAWKSKKISFSVFEFSMLLNEGSAIQQTRDNITLEPNIKYTFEEGAIFSNYGVNYFDDESAFIYKNGVAHFFLPDYDYAKRVYISGSFNAWSTIKTPMQKIENGWVVSIKLQPGKYTYKYIVDGRWIHDPNNKQREKNEHGSYNSVVYCYNHKFTLNAFPNAQKVMLAGSFNNWNPNELRLKKSENGWEISMFLREGTHAYKYIVDNIWVLDPANNDIRPDGRGNINSFIGIGDLFTFKLKGYLNADRVYLAGNFNAWNDRELLMKKTEEGWILPYNLATGNYEYKFIVDGKWITDPDNPNTTGSGDFTNAFLAINPNYKFKLIGFFDAQSVSVSGSFNGWNRDGYRMKKTSAGWELLIYLKPGKHTYKFIVDGKWILDPENKLWEQNEFGTGNSVVWINP